MEHILFYVFFVFIPLFQPHGLVFADDNYYILKTPGDNAHSKMWLTTEVPSVRFSFQGCTDLKVALSTDPQVTTANIYEVIIGGWTNTQSVIRRGLFGTPVTPQVSTPGILSCDELRPFWIGWENGNLTVGTGSNTGLNVVMFYPDPQPYLITAISLSSGYDGGNGNGTYMVNQDEARIALVRTPARIGFDTFWLYESQKTYIRFGIRGCNDALLALSAEIQSMTNSYEVVIGGYGNTRSEIRSSVGGPSSVTLETPGILSCTEIRYFWSSWEGGLIEVGQGLTLGLRRFLAYRYQDPHLVTSVGFSSYDQENDWEFTHNEDDSFLLTTQMSNPTESNWIDVTGKTVFQFRIKGCSFAKIELRSNPDNLNDPPTYLVVFTGLPLPGIGAIEITYLDASNHPILATFEVPDLLSCTLFRRFWFSWKEREIQIGRNNLYENYIATVFDPVAQRTFRTLHLGSADAQYTQEWEYVTSSVKSTVIRTGSQPTSPRFMSSWLTLRGQQSFIFKVSACSDAHILLAAYTKIIQISSYEVLLGGSGNSMSMIGKDGLVGGNVIQANTPNLLHCTESRFFWISWSGGYFQIGSGPVRGENGFLQLEDPQPYRIRAIAFDSISAISSAATWEFGTQEGQSYVVETPSNGFGDRDFFWFATHKMTFAFDVVVCKEAVVSLSNGTHFVMELVIGTNDNTRTILRSLVNENIMYVNDTLSILNCDTKRSFWIDFTYTLVTFGIGQLHEVVIMTANVPHQSIQAIAISTNGVQGIWTISQQAGKMVQTKTPNLYGYTNMWMTVDDRKAIVFRLRICNDAHLVLSNTLGLTVRQTYEIVFGGSANTQSFIRNITQSTSWTTVETPGIVDCSEMRTFWIGWNGGLIRVGRGGVVGVDQFMHFQDATPTPYSIHALGICSGWGAEGLWQFSDFADGTYIVHTSSTTEYVGAWLSVPGRTYFEFRVQACAGAVLVLYSDFYSRLVYEIGFGMTANTLLTLYVVHLGLYTSEIPINDLLSCTEERAFWISWKMGSIQVGRGNYPQSRLLEWTDPSPQDVNSISLVNWPGLTSSDAIWEFSQRQVGQVNVLSRSVGTYEGMTRTVNGRQNLVFSVMTCGDISLALSEFIGLTNNRTYKIAIASGADGDQLEIYSDGVRQAHTHSACAVHCNQFRQFWLSWENGLFKIGYGPVIGLNLYLSWQDLNPHPISSLSVSTNTVPTEWQVERQENNLYMLMTDVPEVNPWIVMQRYEVTFGFDVMTCHDVSIILAGMVGFVNRSAYEIVFGAEENTRVQIRKVIEGKFELMRDAPAFGYVHCNNFATLWVSWSDGIVSAGTGLPHRNAIISWTENPEDFIPIQAVTLGYSALEPIYWNFRRSQVLSLRTNLTRDFSHTRTWMTLASYHSHIVFQVRVCSSVVLYLTSYAHNMSINGSFLVEIGTGLDAYSFIRDGFSNNILAEAGTAGILSCTRDKTFWIGWDGNFVKVGTGAELNYNIFLQYDSTSRPDIRAVGFSTYSGEDGHFRLHDTTGNVYRIFSRADVYDHTSISIKQPIQQFIYLRIRACFGAHIRLDDVGYVVEIGSNDNEQIIIRRSVDGIVAKAVFMPDILSCYESRLFWITWFNRTIEVGNEPSLANTLITWMDDEVSMPAVITGYSLATEIGAIGEWEIGQLEESEVTVKTPDQWDGNYLWTSVLGREYITFDVMACHDAHLALVMVLMHTVTEAYQVIIGGWSNEQSSIRNEVLIGGSTKVIVDTKDILHCSEKRSFWISWSDDTIRVGTGSVPYEYSFMEWKDDNFHGVNAVGMSTRGVTGEWTVKTIQQIFAPTDGPVTESTTAVPTQPEPDYTEENVYTIYTNDTNVFDHFVLTSDQKSFLFSVDACRDVYVFLTHLPGISDDRAYRIIIGSSDNTQSSIYKTHPNEATQNFNTNLILSCSKKFLWVSWADGKISVGQGADINQGQLFTWTDTQPYSINGLALATRDTKTVTWTFLRESGRVMNASTVSDYSYTQLWFSTMSTDSAVLRIQACRDAHILLSESNGMGSNSYEVALGILSNTRSVIREGPYGPNVVSVDSPGIMNCSEFRFFWMRWKDERVQVGVGSVVGMNLLMEHAKENHPENILSIGVSTGWDAIGRWEISNVQGQTFTVYTSPSQSIQTGINALATGPFANYFYSVGMSFQFQLQECRVGLIILATTPLREDTSGYLVTLSDRSSIARLPDIELTSIDTPNLLRCYSLKMYWISWQDGMIRVGRGKLHFNQIMEFKDPSPATINIITIQTPQPSTGGQWQMNANTVGTATFTTFSSGIIHYMNTWHTTNVEQRYIIFKIRACSDARIVLAHRFGITDYEVIEVWLGKDFNTVSTVTDGIGGSILGQANTPALLKCTYSMWFWIDWTQGISVGQGPVTGDQALITVPSNALRELFQIGAISIDSGPNVEAEWEFGNVPARHFTVQTSGVYGHNTAWLIVHNPFIAFQVRACAEVRILLSEDPFVSSRYSHEVLIGGWGNTRSVIFSSNENNTLVEMNTPSILQCLELQEFWIKWDALSQVISVGKGALGIGEFMRYEDPDFHPIHSISISTGNGNPGEWHFLSHSARVFQFNTSTDYAYDRIYYRLTEQKSVTFMVQSCNDAHIGLFDTFLAQVAYEIVLGGSYNQRSFIRRTRLLENKVSIDTPDIVNCNTILPFWVSWADGHIKVGRGNLIDDKMLMEWLDPEPMAVSILAISTGWEATGLWQFSNFEDNDMLVKTPDDYSYFNHWMNLKSSQKFLNFEIQSCHSAHIFLSQLPFMPPLYEVILGSNGNSRSAIIRYTQDDSGINQGVIVAEEETSGLLSCNAPRSFWLSWQDNKIQVARGSAVGQRFLDWLEESPRPTFAMSLATGPDSQGEWKYSMKEVSSFAHITAEYENTYGNVIYSLRDRSEIIFSVLACRDAHLALSEIPGILTHMTYELVIGLTDNTQTILRNGIQGSVTLSLVSTPGILNCQWPQYFWLTWDHISIAFGKGTIPGQNRVLFLVNYPFPPINALSIMTPAGVKGLWDFASFTGDIYELHTPDDGTRHVYDYNIITFWKDIASFLIRACNDAHIALQTIPGSSDDPLIEIVLGGYSNSRSDIRNGKGGSNVLAYYLEDGIMDCNSYRSFWISWRNGFIEVGKNYPDTQRIMSYQLPPSDNLPISAISTTTGWGTDGDWIFFESQVSSLRVTTLPVHDYNQLSKTIMNQNSIVFRVQACRDAHVALSELFNNVQTRTYEIIIGGYGNTQSFIRDLSTGSEKLRLETLDIMDCNNYKAFWVKWEEDGRITVGQGGFVGGSIFLDWTDPEGRSFKGLTISTWNNASGLWDFSFLQGNTYSIFTEADYRYNYTWLWPSKNYLTFKAKSCNDGHILLSSAYQDISNENSYEIVFGSFENTITEIRPGSHGWSLVYAETPNIMNCDLFLPFWVKWEDKILEVGSGPLGSHVLLRLDDPNMPDIRLATVTSWVTSPGEYQFLESEISSIRVNTTGQQSYWTLHQSIIDSQQLKFKVRSTSDAMLALLSVPSNLLAPSYELTIGFFSNTMTVLKSRSPSGDIVIQYDTPAILDPQILRPFWMSWNDGMIQFGTGDIIGQGRLFSFIDPVPAIRKHVHSVAVASGVGLIGEWEFLQQFDSGSTDFTQPLPTTSSSLPPSFTDDFYTVYTDMTKALDSVVVTTDRQYLVFSTDACSEAFIFLTHIPGVVDSMAYEVSLGTSKNAMSGIHKLPPNEEVHEFPTSDVLPCSTSQVLWISWTDGEIMVGVGSGVGENVKFQWKDNQPYSINAFSLFSKDDKQSVWIFQRDFGRIFNMSTATYYSYEQAWLTTSVVDHVVLRVKSCHDPHIVVSEDNGLGDNVYEVAFGIIGNTKSVIREGLQGFNIVAEDTPGIVSCDEFRYFWILWKDTRLEVGVGPVVGVNKLMEHSKPNHPEKILSIGLSTGWEADGRWEISNIEGVAYSLYTDPITDFSNRLVWFYPIGRYFEFQLRSCSIANVRLAAIPMRETTNGYDIILSNTLSSSITKLNEVGIEVSKDTPQLLNCDILRKFWITWSDGIKVGRGKFNSEVLLELADNSPVTITAVAVTTMAPSASRGEWQVLKNTVKSSIFRTPSDYQYKWAWHTTVELKSISFKVRACSDANILLAKFFGITDYGVYELVIGAEGNSKIEIRYGISGISLAEKQSPGLLDCTQSRWFWIDWSKGISIGTGPYVGDSVLLTISTGELPENFPVYATAFSTGSGSDGDWEFTTIPAQQLTVNTPTEYGHSHAWMILERNFFLFQVRSCSEARILLAYDPFDLTTNVKEVVIGGWTNTKSAIYKDMQTNETVAIEDTIKILDCDKFLDFWIQWKDSILTVGQGILNSNEFLRYSDSTLHPIHAVSISTGSGYSGEWQIASQAALVYELQTTTQYDYTKNYFQIGSRTFVTFQVQACNDAHIGLFDQQMLDVAYEIVIGGSGNSISAIRRTRLLENKVWVSTPGILDCTQMLAFWVSWSYAEIRVGRGNLLEESLIMNWKDPTPLAISIVAISTGWSATGIWQFSNIQGKRVKLQTTSSLSFGRHWIELKSSQQYFSFGVRACQSVRILLARNPYDKPLYEVLLGIDGNTKSEIYRYDSSSGVSSVVAQEDTPEIVDCTEIRDFWLGWANSEIEVAIGSGNGKRFLSWKDDSPQRVFSVSLASGLENFVDWDYSYSSVQGVLHETGVDVNDTYRRILVSVMDSKDFVFGVHTCRDAQIALSQMPGILTHLTYELIIGYKSNSETIFRSSIGGDDSTILRSVATPQILDCDTMKLFWLKWEMSKIAFGSGSVVGQNELLRVDNDPKWHPINSLSFLTPTMVTGVWAIPSFGGNVYELHTPDDGEDYKYVYNVLTTNDDKMMFWVRACNDAHVLLQTVPGSMNDQAYEIVIGGWTNTRSVIRDKIQGNELIVSTDPLPLHCDEYRQFWVTWRNNDIEVGKNFPYTQSFLFYKIINPNTSPITAMTFTSGWGSDADWMVFENDVTLVRVTTLPRHDYNQLSKTIMNQNSIVFRVQACRDAHVALSELFNNVQTRTYEIIIGGYGNTQSFIRDFDTGFEVQKIPTTDFMDCDNFRAFWVKWEGNGRITVGKGAILGKETFLDWIDGEGRQFKGLTISTWNDAPGIWDFSFLQGDVYSLFTDAEYRYNYTWFAPASNSLTFKVRSCDNAHLLLASQWLEENIDAYEIVIGGYGNTLSDIRRGAHGPILLQANTPDIMNCDEYLPFWVKWEDKTIQIGRGNMIGEHIFMDLQDSDMHTINAASITSWESAPGEYQFQEQQILNLRGFTISTQEYRTVHLSLIDRQQIIFRVKAKSDAKLLLMMVPSNYQAASYELEIGCQGNTKSRLHLKSLFGDTIYDADTSDVLSDLDFRYFWISWIDSSVQFGFGNVVGQDRKISVQDSQSSYRNLIHSVAIATGVGLDGEGLDGEWEFARVFNEGETTPTTAATTTHLSSTTTTTVTTPTSTVPSSSSTHTTTTTSSTTRTTLTTHTTTLSTASTAQLISTVGSIVRQSVGMNPGSIAGLIMGCFAAFLIISLLLMNYAKKYKAKKSRDENQQIHFDNPAYYGNVVEMKQTSKLKESDA